MKEVIIRRMKTDEYFLLKEFTYHAIYVPTGVNMPPKHIVELPELKVYGSRKGYIDCYKIHSFIPRINFN